MAPSEVGLKFRRPFLFNLNRELLFEHLSTSPSLAFPELDEADEAHRCPGFESCIVLLLIIHELRKTLNFRIETCLRAQSQNTHGDATQL